MNDGPPEDGFAVATLGAPKAFGAGKPSPLGPKQKASVSFPTEALFVQRFSRAVATPES